MAEHNIDTKVALLDAKVTAVVSNETKFEYTIEKLTEVSQSLKEMISIHQLKIEEIDRNSKKLQDYLDRDNHMTHKRINDLTEKVKTDMDEQYSEIMSTLSDIRKEQREYHQQSMADMNALKSDIKKDEESKGSEQTKKWEGFEKRLTNVERWRWTMAGGLLLAVFLVQNGSFLIKLFGG